MKSKFVFRRVQHPLIFILILFTLSLPVPVTAGEISPPVQDPQTQPDESAQKEESKPSSPEGKVLVKFKTAEDIHSQGFAELSEEIGIEQVEPVFNEALISEESIRKLREQFPERKIPQDVKIQNLKNWNLVKYTGNADPENACKITIKKLPEAACQPNYSVKGYWIPNDPYFHSQGAWDQNYDDLWALKKLNMPAAWDITRGNGIVVAVVDSGLDYKHPDIRDNVWSNPGEIPDDGIDNDGNGFIDDSRGWNFVSNNNDSMDTHGHGTHVSGIISARGNNNFGIIGVAPEAKIMPVKSLGDLEAGTIRDFANGILYAAVMGAHVIHNSWGCQSRCPSNPIAEDAVSAAHVLGAVLVFAAGNSAEPVKFYSPQNMAYPYPKPIVVTAATEADTLAYFSNFGELIDVAAPGAGRSYQSRYNILSLKSSGINSNFAARDLWIQTNFLRQTGTSMSAAYVSGIAALLKAHHPSWTHPQVRHALRLSADPMPGFEFSMGTGRINAARALALASVPSLQAEIISPAPDTLMTLPCGYPIVGVAAGNHFSRYQLFYRLQGVTSPWIPIHDPVSQPVEHGILGTVGQCPPTGAYLLKLAVTSASGQAIEKISRVIFEPPFRPVSVGPSIEHPPSIDGGRIVWEDGETRDIYLYTISKGERRQITRTKAALEQNPSISGDRITYVRIDDSYNSPPNLVLFDLSSGQDETLTSSNVFIGQPDIDGTHVVYPYSYYSDSQIRLYDISSRTETIIASDPHPFHNHSPRVSGDKIVWIKTMEFEQDMIYVHDIATGNQQSLVNAGRSRVDGLDIHQNKIVYSLHRKTGGTALRSSLYLYDLAAMTQRRLSSSPRMQSDLKISGNRIVWSTSRSCVYLPVSCPNIFSYDLRTNTEQQITAEQTYQMNPDVSGNRIVWLDYRNGIHPNHGDLYMAELSD